MKPLRSSMVVTVLSVAIIIWGIQSSQTIGAQEPNFSSTAQPKNFSQPLLTESNQTGSISIYSSLLEVLKSKAKFSLSQAISNVSMTLGPNSTVLSASVQSEAGSLVYRVVALDSSNNIHLVLLDPANGNILSKQQWPASETRALSEIPGIGPRSEGLPVIDDLPGIGPDLRIP